MDITSTEGTAYTSPLKFKVGGATMIFETVEDWKDDFKNLIVRSGAERSMLVPSLMLSLQLPACEAVRI